MNVSSILRFTSNNTRKTTPASPKFNYQLQKDTISFSSRSLISNSLGENIGAASSIGKQIYTKLTHDAQTDELISIIKKDYPDVDVKPTNKLNIEDGDIYEAFYAYRFDDDFSPKSPQFYVNLKNFKNPSLNMVCACNVAHEYTHLIQSYNPKSIEEYKALANCDRDYLDLIAGLGDSIFKYYDTEEQGKMLIGIFDKYDMSNVQKYGKIIPRIKNINKNIILRNSIYRDENEFKTSVISTFEELFDMATKQILDLPDNQILPHIKERFKKVLSNDELEKLKQDTKKYIEISARSEKEAYASECQVAKKILKTDESLNIDCFPLYYQMLEKAFK